MELIDQITITDRLGFVYKVQVQHFPGAGVSIAYHNDQRIASREYGRMQPPMSDNDNEWEQWDERFAEWAADAISDLTISCKDYFDKSD